MTVRDYPLRLELLDDVVFSRRSATAGGHESLDKVPGSALLGWAAAQLYERLGEQAFLVFHSGAVRFCDGLPLSPAGERCAPVPLAWHEDKADAQGRADDGRCWRAPHIFNLAAGGEAAMAPGAQPRQLRSGYVGSDGACMRPATRYRMMTAIGEAGRAADGQLFGYESLVRGQRFEARLGIDDALPLALREQVLACFDGTIRLGRSRASQYGRVRSQVLAPCAPQPLPEAGRRLVLWLMSDAWLHTPEGQPTLVPEAEALGLEGARLDRAASFLRTRRYSPWNAHRRRHEMERQVLCAGSVLTFEHPQGFPAQAVERVARGIGAGLAQGLGEVRLQSPLLMQPRPAFTAPARTGEAAPAPVVPPRPASALLGFLARRSGAAQRGGSAQAFVQQALRSLVQELGRIRAFRSCAPDMPLGPGRSQWGQLATLARQATTLAALRTALLDEGHGACRQDDDTWYQLGYQSTGDPARRSLATWVDEQLLALACQPGLGDAQQLYAWQLLCGEARKLDLNTGAQALDTARRTLGDMTKETV